MTAIEHNSIVDQVKHQFPSFYKEHGADFIMFLEAYYEWLEQESGLEYTRQLFKITDIDDTYDRFLENFREKYMHGLPGELLGNQRLLQKHILELYRSKGSDAGLKLLFRLLYNEDVEKYIPSYDIFKASDNTWIQPQYIEVTSSPLLPSYVGQQVYGLDTGASAVVESVESKFINGKMAHLLFISNVKGVFAISEKVVVNEDDLINAPTIRGSVTELRVLASFAGFSVGDIIVAGVGDKPVEAAVSGIYSGSGLLDFTLVNGGTYYSMDAEIVISQGANTQGTGASVVIGSIANTFPFTWNTDTVLPFANTALNDTFEFASNPTANLESVIDTCLDFETKTVGTINSIIVTNPGTDYDASPTLTITDPYTSTSGIVDSNGNQVGTNAILTSVPIYGDGLIGTVRILSSGYEYQDRQLMTFYDENAAKTATAILVKTGVGIDYGYYDNTKSFLSDDKYLFDGHYYQDYSYVLRSAHTLDKYVEILKKVYHPAGNAVFGDVKIIASNSLTNDAVVNRVIKDYDTVNTETVMFDTRVMEEDIDMLDIG